MPSLMVISHAQGNRIYYINHFTQNTVNKPIIKWRKDFFFLKIIVGKSVYLWITIQELYALINVMVFFSLWGLLAFSGELKLCWSENTIWLSLMKVDGISSFPYVTGAQNLCSSLFLISSSFLVCYHQI